MGQAVGDTKLTVKWTYDDDVEPSEVSKFDTVPKPGISMYASQEEKDKYAAAEKAKQAAAMDVEEKKEEEKKEEPQEKTEEDKKEEKKEEEKEEKKEDEKMEGDKEEEKKEEEKKEEEKKEEEKKEE